MVPNAGVRSPSLARIACLPAMVWLRRVCHIQRLRAFPPAPFALRRNVFKIGFFVPGSALGGRPVGNERCEAVSARHVSSNMKSLVTYAGR